MSKKGHLPAYLSEAERRRDVNRRSARQESAHAAETGGKVQRGSGSSHRAPEDVVGPLSDDGEGFLDQLKQYVTGRFTIRADEWEKLRGNAHRCGREPRLIIEFPEQEITLIVVEKDT